jgi:hypothetical protein
MSIQDAGRIHDLYGKVTSQMAFVGRFQGLALLNLSKFYSETPIRVVF